MNKILSALPLSAAGAAIAVASFASPSHALAVFGNQLYTDNQTSTNSSGINDTATPPQQKALSFRTDGRAWSLNSVILSLGNLDSADTPLIQIRADNAGNPSATVLYTLTNPDLTNETGEFGDYTFTGAGQTLAANTNYWLVVTGLSYNWLRVGNGANLPSQTPNQLNSSGWTSPDGYKFTGTGNPTWGIGNSVRNAFVIDATEIAPVPFAFTPVPGLIVSGIIGRIKRSKKKAVTA